MITEIRHIIFSNDEMKLVFQTVPPDGFDPARRITRIQIVEGPPPMVQLHAEGMPTLEVESYQLARLIVAYCRDKKIPLPKDALKTLHAQGDALCFSIMSTLAEETGQAPKAPVLPSWWGADAGPHPTVGYPTSDGRMAPTRRGSGMVGLK